jgi:ATP-dependent helicase/nuclease subunit B
MISRQNEVSAGGYPRVPVLLLLGPAGAGKTWRCVDEIRSELVSAPCGEPLLLLTPRQATFQYEQRLLAQGTLRGYTRLLIAPFERLALEVLDRLRLPAPATLSEQGQTMVLRALLARERQRLRLCQASARFHGFAQELAATLRELNQHQATPKHLSALAQQLGPGTHLGLKLHDLALLWSAYRDWLSERHLHDSEAQVEHATAALRALAERGADRAAGAGLRFGGLWVDGLAEVTPQQLEFLAALVPFCRKATIAFCLEAEDVEGISWLSAWSPVAGAFRRCRERFVSCSGIESRIELLPRSAIQGRFSASPDLAVLEAQWQSPMPRAHTTSDPRTCGPEERRAGTESSFRQPGAIRVIRCASPEAEAIAAARQILAHVHAGGRFRETGILVRRLEDYAAPIRRVFARYEIPFFLDRREPAAHHPVAELTRHAVRLAACGWQLADWLSLLKTGLAAMDMDAVDHLETQALAGPWRVPEHVAHLLSAGAPVAPRETPIPGPGAVVNALLRFTADCCGSVRAEGSGRRQPGIEAAPVPAEVLARALRALWVELDVADQLARWSCAGGLDLETHRPQAIHWAAWEEISGWLDDFELAFQGERSFMSEWLPIVESGLGGLSVGVIPPTLDQVLVGAVDRSRNPDLKLGVVLGMNDGVFPAPVATGGLLTEDDRERLAGFAVPLGASVRDRLALEQYLAYIACTRPSERLVLTWAARDNEDRLLQASPFLDRLLELFPGLNGELAAAAAGSEPVSDLPEAAPGATRVAAASSWSDCLHACEALPLLAQATLAGGTDRASPHVPPASAHESGAAGPCMELLQLPRLEAARDRLQMFRGYGGVAELDPEIAAALYGGVLVTSATQLEQFAQCPFKFFVDGGMRAKERQLFEPDAREEGSFQHEVLAQLHLELQGAGKAWRDLTPEAAADVAEGVARRLAANFHDGLLVAAERGRFRFERMVRRLRQVVAAIVGGMANYQFDPRAVEVEFGRADPDVPAWRVDLLDGHGLECRGKIDRVDLARGEPAANADCVVIDYKSGQARLEPVLVEAGIQLQLQVYLHLLRQMKHPAKVFGVEHIEPRGVFLVQLREHYERAKHRGAPADEDEPPPARPVVRYSGRFEFGILRALDSREGRTRGDMINYRLKKSGGLHGGPQDAMADAAFQAWVLAAEERVRHFGRAIYAGVVRADPYRRGSELACDRCLNKSICRIDPWSHHYRVLRGPDR